MEVKKVLTSEQMKFKKLLLELPKTEIHLHLEGVASVETIWALMKKNNLQYKNVNSKSDLQKKFQITSLEDFLDVFMNIIQKSFITENDIEYLIDDAKNYLLENNIIYSELFFAPSKFIQMGLDFKKIAKILTQGAEKIKKNHNIDIKFLIDVSRSFGLENAMKNLDLILANPSDAIIGIGLGGSEKKGPAKDYATVFEKAISKGLHVVAHAGEDVESQSIWDAINYLKAERIGHGISAIEDEKLMAYLAEKQIPLEVCPTSNLFTRKYAKTLKEHPVKLFFSRNMYITINTDDPTIFSATLVEEYMNLLTENIFTEKEIIQIIKNGVYATFLPASRKNAIWKAIEAKLPKQYL
ncbi:MAG: adenosine deaminase [Spirochaetaceae bacterium]|nr:adenosine deaminase [Spirochaetaceae bacterium]